MTKPDRAACLETAPSASDDRYARWLGLGGDFFEEIIAAIYKAHVRPGDQVVDVGANHGRHTVPLARCVGRRGRVIAIEPLPHLAATLVETSRRLPQVRVISKAMSCDEGETEFVWVRRSEGFSGIRERQMPEGLSDDLTIIKVKKSTLDETTGRSWGICRRRLSFIKIDIEGGEYDALMGAKAVILRHRPIIVFENGGPSASRSYDYSEDQFFELFEALQCDVYDIFGRPLTRNSWRSGDTPWYAIAVAKGSQDAAFIRERLPGMIERIEDDFVLDGRREASD